MDLRRPSPLILLAIAALAAVVGALVVAQTRPRAEPIVTASAVGASFRTGSATSAPATVDAAAGVRALTTAASFGNTAAIQHPPNPAQGNARRLTAAMRVEQSAAAITAGVDAAQVPEVAASLEQAAVHGDARALRLLADLGQLTAHDAAQADAFEDLYLSQYLTAWRMGDPEGLRRLQQNLPANATRVEVLSWLHGSDLHLRRIDEARAARGLPRLVLTGPPPAAPR